MRSGGRPNLRLRRILINVVHIEWFMVVSCHTWPVLCIQKLKSHEKESSVFRLSTVPTFVHLNLLKIPCAYVSPRPSILGRYMDQEMPLGAYNSRTHTYISNFPNLRSSQIAPKNTLDGANMRSFLAILSIPLVLARTLELHHRLITPATALTADQSTPEWLPLGSLELSTDLTSSPTRLKPASSSHTKLDLSDKSAKEDGAWYQVGVRGEEGWVYGSTRAVSHFYWSQWSSSSSSNRVHGLT